MRYADLLKLKANEKIFQFKFGTSLRKRQTQPHFYFDTESFSLANTIFLASKMNFVLHNKQENFVKTVFPLCNEMQFYCLTFRWLQLPLLIETNFLHTNSIIFTDALYTRTLSKRFDIPKKLTLTFERAFT